MSDTYRKILLENFRSGFSLFEKISAKEMGAHQLGTCVMRSSLNMHIKKPHLEVWFTCFKN